MLSIPTPVIDPVSQKLNPAVLNAIKACKKPHLVMVCSPTKIDKSSIMNQLILGQKDSRLCNCESPFETEGDSTGCARGCNVLGPFTVKELSERMLLGKQMKPDDEIFFIDSEGTTALNEMNENLMAAILTILQVAAVSVIIINGAPEMDVIKPLFSQIQISNILKNSCKRIKEGEICKPIVFCSSIENLGEPNVEKPREFYLNQGLKIIELIESMDINEADGNETEKKKDEMLDIASKLAVIASPPYIDNKFSDNSEVNEGFDLYWDMISCLLQEIIDATKVCSRTGEETAELMDILYKVFMQCKNVTTGDIREPLINIANQQFESKAMEFLNNHMSTLLEEAKSGKEESFKECISLIEDQMAASDLVLKCINPNLLNLYKKLIPRMVQEFAAANVVTIQKDIQNMLNEKIGNIMRSIIEQENIEKHLRDLANRASAAVFREDILETYQNMWNQEVESKRVIFEYFEKTKPESFNTLKSNFINRLTQDSTAIVNSKPQWTSYKDSKISEIRKRAGARLNELKKMIEYLEDKDRIIPSAENLRNELNIFEVANAPLNESRKKEISDESLAVCQEERNKLSLEGIRKWSDVEAEIVAAANQAIDDHLLEIQNTNYRDDIDRSKIVPATLRAIIPNDLIQSVKPSRIREVQATLTNLVLERSKSFEGKIDNIPLWEDCKEALIDLSYQCATSYINEILRPKYFEDIPDITANDIFENLQEQGFYQNGNIKASKNSEAVSIIREVADQILKEFNNAKRQKMSWKSIMCDKIQMVRVAFEATKNEVLDQFYYRDLNAKPNPFGNYQPIVSRIPNLYNDVEQHKRGELDNQIKAIASEYERAFNSSANEKPSWNDVTRKFAEMAIQVAERIVFESLSKFTYSNDWNEYLPNPDEIFDQIINTPFCKEIPYPDMTEILKIAQNIANQEPERFKSIALNVKPQRETIDRWSSRATGF